MGGGACFNVLSFQELPFPLMFPNCSSSNPRGRSVLERIREGKMDDPQIPKRLDEQSPLLAPVQICVRNSSDIDENARIIWTSSNAQVANPSKLYTLTDASNFSDNWSGW